MVNYLTFVILMLTALFLTQAKPRKLSNHDKNIKTLIKSKEPCPTYCNVHFKQCKRMSIVKMEKKLCVKAVIVCYYACAGKYSKRKMLKKLAKLIPKSIDKQI